jgi:hypothetical protein
MPMDPINRGKPLDPFARRAAEQRREDAKKAAQGDLAKREIPSEKVGPKPAPSGNPFKARPFDPRLLFKPQFKPRGAARLNRIGLMRCRSRTRERGA